MSDNFKKNKSKECLIEEYLCNITSKCESQIPIYKEKKNKLNNKEIKIPTIKSYNELYSNNYNITQLKSFAKHYKLKISGNKQELINRIYIFLYFSSYIIKIQKHFRRTLVKKYKNLHGPASINRKLCTNKNDFITNYKNYKQNINEIDSILEQPSSVDPKLDVSDILILLVDLDSKNINYLSVAEIKYYKDLLELLETKISSNNQNITTL
jgi:hypothetical protein